MAVKGTLNGNGSHLGDRAELELLRPGTSAEEAAERLLLTASAVDLGAGPDRSATLEVGRSSSVRGIAEMVPGTAFDAEAIEAAVEDILLAVGEDPAREGLAKTPLRVAKMYAEMLEGYALDVETVVNGAVFDVQNEGDEIVAVADIPFTSMCEHHMLPFVGRAHVGYIPRDKVIGLSKIPRIVDMYARRLQIQERMSNEIADALADAIDAEGVMVLVEGEHSCAALRGVKKHGVNMVTTARRGAFREDASLRDEFYRAIRR